MRQITGLTNDTKQQFDAVIEGYDVANIYLEYKPNQFGWFMDVTWGEFSTNNLRVTVGPNILRQFKNIIPFGIAISGVDSVDPVTVDDWLGHNVFYILDETDKALVEDAING